MPTYPTTLKVSPSSTKSLKTDRQLDRASNGTLRGRVFYTAPKSSFSVEHEAMSTTDRDSFQTFYNTNMNLSFSFVWPQDGVTYTVMFGDKEPVFKPAGGDRVSIGFSLEQV